MLPIDILGHTRNIHIGLGISVESTTQTGYFLSGLRLGIVNTLNGVAEPEAVRIINMHKWQQQQACQWCA